MSAHLASIKKTDAKLRIVYAEVLIPSIPDSQGEFIVAEEIRKAAHGFLRNHRGSDFDSDTNHDGSTNECYVVESFIARKGDPEFIEDAWVVGMQIVGDDMWEKVEKGEINGFSVEALVVKSPAVIEWDIPDLITGETEASNGHVHTFAVKYDDSGNFLGGQTNEVEGHSHQIRNGTITDTTLEHNHRYAFVEYLL